MLTSDNLLEIAYRTDYLTTLDLLIACPNFNTYEFWEYKWQFMYSNRPSLPFFTNQDVFLMMERKKFVLAFDYNGRLYKNILYEDDGTLIDNFQKYSKSEPVKYVTVDVKAQYLLFDMTFKFISQYNTYNNLCRAICDKEILPSTCGYYINMNNIVISFVNRPLERKPTIENAMFRF